MFYLVLAFVAILAGAYLQFRYKLAERAIAFYLTVKGFFSKK